MVSLADVRDTLVAEFDSAADLPPHLVAFCQWVTQDISLTIPPIFSPDQSIEFQYMAVLGYKFATESCDSHEERIFRKGLQHLSGRTFFVPGRPQHLESDGVALLGLALGIRSIPDLKRDTEWFRQLLKKSEESSTTEDWLTHLIRVALYLSDEVIENSLLPADLVCGLSRIGVFECPSELMQKAWSMVVSLSQHDDGPTREAVRLSAFSHVLQTLSSISISSLKSEDLTSLLEAVPRALRRWVYESKPRTKQSRRAVWDIENEYHVQSLLWSILSPVFPDLEDEENLPSFGHKHPRYDLGVRSIRTIVEVKFIKKAGQRAFSDLIEQVAADSSLYLSARSGYREIVVFVWDDTRNTQEHHELRSGLTEIRGVKSAIIVSRPGHMDRKLKACDLADHHKL